MYYCGICKKEFFSSGLFNVHNIEKHYCHNCRSFYENLTVHRCCLYCKRTFLTNHVCCKICGVCFNNTPDIYQMHLLSCRVHR